MWSLKSFHASNPRPRHAMGRRPRQAAAQRGLSSRRLSLEAMEDRTELNTRINL